MIVVVINGLFPVMLTNVKFFDWLSTLFHKDKITDREDSPTMKPSNSNLIVTVFNNEQLLHAFKEYATQNWAIENVLFYEEVNRFRSSVSNSASAITSTMVADAQRIFDTYLETNAVSRSTSMVLSRMTFTRNSAQASSTVNSSMLPKSLMPLLIQHDTLIKWQRTVSFKSRVEAIVHKAGSESYNGSMLEGGGSSSPGMRRSYGGGSGSGSGSQLPILSSIV